MKLIDALFDGENLVERLEVERVDWLSSCGDVRVPNDESKRRYT
jgi:hypothetical protein